nr:hypothetical protein CFP56_53227 [Quercus suber]
MLCQVCSAGERKDAGGVPYELSRGQVLVVRIVYCLFDERTGVDSRCRRSWWSCVSCGGSRSRQGKGGRLGED